MTPCPSAEHLRDYLAGAPGADAATIEAHVEFCPACERILAELSDAGLREVLSSRSTADHDPTPRSGDRSPQTFGTSTLDAPLGKLGPYRILRELGSGGFGTVFLAHDELLDRSVALKVPRPERAVADGLARFEREGRRAAAIHHPNVVAVHALARAPEHPHPFLVMQFVDGESLQGLLVRRVRLDPREAADIVRQAAHGLSAAHALGQIHRDVKPGNVMIERGTGRVLVGDFGLARREDAGGTRVTRAGTLLGTPAYMAPEQIRTPDQVDARADVYALGATLYELLTGEPPFVGAGPMEVLQQSLHDDPRPLRRLNAAVPADLDAICMKCLEKEPARRYPSAAALADDLGRFLAGEPTLARPPGTVRLAAKWVRRNKVVSGATAAVIGALLTGTIVSLGFMFKADAERDHANTARNEETKAKNELAARTDDLAKSNDDLEEALARAFHAPLGLSGPGTPVHPREVEALWGLTYRRGSRVSERFLKEAVTDRWKSEQLRLRAPFALHAAIGLDPDLRDRAERLLVDGMRSGPIDSDKVDLAITAAALDGLSPASATDVATVLAGRLTTPPEWLKGERLKYEHAIITHRLEAVALALDAQRADAVYATLADRLTDPFYAPALVALAERMTPETAFDALVRGMDHNDRLLTDRYLPEWGMCAAGLRRACARMPAERAADRLVARIRGEDNPFVQHELAVALADLAAQNRPRLAQHVTDAASLLSKRLRGKIEGERAPHPDDVREWTIGLATLADQLPDSGDSFTAALAREIAARLQGKFPYFTAVLADGIGILAAHPGRGETRKVCHAAAEWLASRAENTALIEKNETDLRFAAEGINALAPGLTRQDAEGVSRRAATRLVMRMRQPREWGQGETLAWLGGRIANLAKWMGQRDRQDLCGRAADELLKQLGDDDTRAEDIAYLLDAVVALAPAVADDLRERICKTAGGMLIERMKAGKRLVPDADSLLALIAAMNPAVAREACSAASTIMSQKIRGTLGQRNLFKRDDYSERLLAFSRWEDPVQIRWFLIDLLSSTDGLEEIQPALFFGLVDAWERGKKAGQPADPQFLVDLLKHPFCVGEARRGVLDGLGRHYGQPFANQWEFVRFARTHQPKLDLVTPPSRPVPLAVVLAG